MSERFRRNYSFADGILLAHVGKVNETLPEDLPTFEAEFPMINQGFLEGMIEDHEVALEEGGDDVAKGSVGLKTQHLLDENGTVEAACQAIAVLDQPHLCR